MEPTNSTNKKRAEYASLVQKRKACRECLGVRNPAEPGLVELDCNEIGPWSLWHGDLDAEIMIVAQDWGDIAYYRRFRGRDDPHNATMKTLINLARQAGLDLGSYERPNRQARVFLSNAVLCLKPQGMQSKVESAWLRNCGTSFLRPLIEVVAPQFVITLGGVALEAVGTAFRLRIKKEHLNSIVTKASPIRLNDKTSLLALYHCSRRVLNRDRPINVQEQDWRRVMAAVRSAKPTMDGGTHPPLFHQTRASPGEPNPRDRSAS